MALPSWTGVATLTTQFLYLATVASFAASLQLMDRIYKRYRLAVNSKKIESMTTTTNRKYLYGDEDGYPDSVIDLDGKKIKNAANFRYLGSQVKHDENTTASTK